MAKQTEAQKKAHNKYRREKTKNIQLQWPVEKHRRVMAYAAHVGLPATTWVKQLIERTISADTTFTYNPEPNEEDENAE